jgi:hypothetical protein
MKTKLPPKQISKQTPPPKQTPKQTSSTLQDSMISGFGIGISSSIAHNLMNKFFSTTKSPSPPQTDSRCCDYLITELDTCVSLNKNCSDLYAKLKLHECQYEKRDFRTG